METVELSKVEISEEIDEACSVLERDIKNCAMHISSKDISWHRELEKLRRQLSRVKDIQKEVAEQTEDDGAVYIYEYGKDIVEDVTEVFMLYKELETKDYRIQYSEDEKKWVIVEESVTMENICRPLKNGGYTKIFSFAMNNHCLWYDEIANIEKSRLSMAKTCADSANADENIRRKCKDCGTSFNITKGEEEFFNGLHYSLPVRCKCCRDKKRMRTA